MHNIERLERATYTVPEVARILGLSRVKAYEEARAGRIPTLRFGTKIVVPHGALERLLSCEASAK